MLHPPLANRTLAASIEELKLKHFKLSCEEAWEPVAQAWWWLICSMQSETVVCLTLGSKCCGCWTAFCCSFAMEWKPTPKTLLCSEHTPAGSHYLPSFLCQALSWMLHARRLPATAQSIIVWSLNPSLQSTPELSFWLFAFGALVPTTKSQHLSVPLSHRWSSFSKSRGSACHWSSTLFRGYPAHPYWLPPWCICQTKISTSTRALSAAFTFCAKFSLSQAVLRLPSSQFLTSALASEPRLSKPWPPRFSYRATAHTFLGIGSRRKAGLTRCTGWKRRRLRASWSVHTW